MNKIKRLLLVCILVGLPQKCIITATAFVCLAMHVYMCIYIYVCVSLYVCAMHNPRCCCEFWCWQLYFMLHFTGHFPFLYVMAFVWVCCDYICVLVCVCVFSYFFRICQNLLGTCDSTRCAPRYALQHPQWPEKGKIETEIKKRGRNGRNSFVCACVCVWVQLKLTCRQRIRLLTNTSAVRYIYAAAV